MANQDRRSLFNRLSRLFKAAPIIKSKIKAASSYVELPASSFLQHSRSSSHMYANAIASYGTYDRLSVSLSTKIAVPDTPGFLTLEELIARYPNGEKFIVYAYDDEKKQIVPAWAHHPRHTHTDPAVCVEFDDGNTLVCTPDHKCMLRDGTFKEAQDLKSGDSMMPFYRKQFNGKSKVDGKQFKDYRSIYTMSKDSWRGWESEHHLIAEWFYDRKVIRGTEHVHHIDHDPENNNPENLEIVNAHEHLSQHAYEVHKMWEDDNFRANFKKIIKEKWDNDDGTRRAHVAEVNKREDVREKRSQYWKENNVAKNPEVAKKIGASTHKLYSEKKELFFSKTNDDIVTLLNENNYDAKKIAKSLKINPSVLKAWVRDKTGIILSINKSDKKDYSKFANYWTGKNRTEQFKEDRKAEKNPVYRHDLTIKKITDEAVKNNFDNKATCKALRATNKVVLRHIRNEGFANWKELCNFISTSNHKVRRVYSAEGSVKLGDMTVCDYENFATDTIIVHNSRYADFSEMEYSVSAETLIPLPGQQSKSIGELADLCSANPSFTFPVYAYDHKLGEIVPAIGKQARKTRTSDEAWKVSFDNGKEIIGSPNHRLMLRDGSYCRIDELQVGDSMMPFIREPIVEGTKDQLIYSINTKETVYNGYEYESSLLERHKSKLAEWVSVAENKEGLTLGKLIDISEKAKFNLVRCTRVSNYRIADVIVCLKAHGFKNYSEFTALYSSRNPRIKLTLQNMFNAFERGMTIEQFCKSAGASSIRMNSTLKKLGFKNFNDWQKNFQNCKVISIEKLEEKFDLYDLTVDGYKNFATDCIISHNTPEIASSLDLIADETVASDERGRSLHVYSDNQKIRELLESLFYDTLNIEFTLRGWVRNLPIKYNTLIPLLSGETITIKELSDRITSGKTEWVYSMQDETQQVVPGKVVWCGKNYTANKIVKVTLDDMTCIETALEHPFILRDGNSKRADKLVIGDSLMPLYTKLSNKTDKDTSYELDGYEKVYNIATNSYEYTHRIVAKNCNIEKDCEKGVIHHKDFKKLNNDPSNLRIMTFIGHGKLHGDHCKEVLHTPEVTAKRIAGLDKWLRSDEHKEFAKTQLIKLQEQGLMKKSWDEYNNSELHREHNAIRSASGKAMWADVEKRTAMQKHLRISFDSTCLDFVFEIIDTNKCFINKTKICKLLQANQSFIDYLISINTYSVRDVCKSINPSTLQGMIQRLNFVDYEDAIVKKFPRLINDKEYKKAIKRKSIRIKVWEDKKQQQQIVQDTSVTNHKVIDVKIIDENCDVYCMTVIGPNGEEDRHNFAICSNKDTKSGVFVKNCKYGDSFMFIDVHTQFGVINVFPIPVNEIEREEGYDPENPMAVRFRWATQGNQILENWMVAHFRLQGNDNFLPYGSSMIEPARRIWRQLILIEDAMLVYRIIRSPERRVFYIDVANIDSKDVPTFLEKVKTGLKRQSVVNTSTGRVDIRYNPLPVWKNTLIPMLDNTVMTIEQLANRFEESNHLSKQGYTDENHLWVYAINEKTHQIVPGKVVWCGKNYTAKQMVKVVLDDNSWLMTAPEHPFILRDGTKIRADALKQNDSLMPFYRRLNSKGYEEVYNPATNDYEKTHRLIAKDFYKDKLVNTEKAIVHHKDFKRAPEINKLDNRPENLEMMDTRKYSVRWNETESSISLNHSVKSVELVDFEDDVYCMTVVGHDTSSDDRHNFAMLTFKDDLQPCNGSMTLTEDVMKLAQRNPKFGGLFLGQSVDEDYFIPIRGDSGTKIETLSGGQFPVRQDTLVTLLDGRTLTIKQIAEEYKNGKINWVYSVQNKTQEIVPGKIVWAGLNYHCDNIQRVWLDDGTYIDMAPEHPVVMRDGSGRRADKLVSGDSLMPFRTKKTTTKDVTTRELLSPNDPQLQNHSVTRVETISGESDDVYCMTVVGPNGEEDRHNFAVRSKSLDCEIELDDNGFDVQPIEMNGIFVKNTGDIEDVEYIQRKLFAALKIPKAYLTYDEALCITADTIVPLSDGQQLCIKDVANRFEESNRVSPQQPSPAVSHPKKLEVYTFDNKQNKIVPCKIKWCGPTKAVDKLIEVTLDDNSTIQCTHNHPFMLRNSSFKRADELLSGDSLMPLYRKVSSTEANNYLSGYEMIYNPVKERWDYTHREFGKDKYNNLSKRNVIHHVNFDKRDNSSDNLLFMEDGKLHQKFHATLNRIYKKYSGSDNPNFNRDANFKMLLSIAESCSSYSELCERTQYGVRVVNRLIHENNMTYQQFADKYMPLATGQYRCISRGLKFDDIINAINNFTIQAKDINRTKVCEALDVNSTVLAYTLRKEGYKNWHNFRDKELRKLSKEHLLSAFMRHETAHDVFEEEYKDKCSASHFATVVNNLFGGKRQARKLAQQEAQAFNNHKVIHIEEIALDEPVLVYDLTVDDENHNFAIIPKRNENTDDLTPCNYQLDDLQPRNGNVTQMLESGIFIHNSGKSVLAQEDIRFSRTITQIQKVVISELNKIAMIHLASHGFEGQDLVNFKLALSNPSTAAQQQKLELWRSRFEIATTVKDTGLLSSRWIQKNIFLLDDQEIEAIKSEKLEEKKEEAEIEAAASQVAQETGIGGAPAGGEGGPPGAGAGGLPPEVGGEDLKGIMGGEHPPGERKKPGELLKTGIEHEWDIIAPSADKPELLDEIEDNANKLLSKIKNDYNEERPKGRVRRGKPHKSLAWGVDATEIPDMSTHVDYQQDHDKDVFDTKYARQVAKMSAKIDEKKRTVDQEAEKYLNEKISTVARMDAELETTLKNFRQTLNVARKNAPTSVKQILLAEIAKNLEKKEEDTQIDEEIIIENVEKDDESKK